jgi:hypothetical protein
MNHFFPSLKLADKLRVKSKTRRMYKPPLTPYARVLASPYVSEERKQLLRQVHATLNPLELSTQHKLVRKQIDDAFRHLRAGKDSAALRQAKLLQQSVTQASQALPTRKK